MKTISNILRNTMSVLLVGTSVALSGCASNHHLAQLKNMINAPVQPTHTKSIVRKTPIYHPAMYVNKNKNNPFVSFSEYQIREEAMLAGKSKLPGGVVLSAKTPLQRYALSSISVVGMIHDQKKWVILLTPNGKFYKASLGTPIGIKHGKIISIHDGIAKKFIAVLQYAPNPFGGFKKETVHLSMGTKGN